MLQTLSFCSISPADNLTFHFISLDRSSQQQLVMLNLAMSIKNHALRLMGRETKLSTMCVRAGQTTAAATVASANPARLPACLTAAALSSQSLLPRPSAAHHHSHAVRFRRAAYRK